MSDRSNTCSGGVEDTLSQEVQLGSSIHLAFEEFEPCDLALRLVVYLQPAAKYKRPVWRPSPEQKGAVHRAIMSSQRPSPPGDALAAGCADARRLLRPASLTASHHRGLLTPLLAVATAVRDTAAPLSTSRRDRSGPRPSLAYRAATAWPSLSPWLARAAAVLG